MPGVHVRHDALDDRQRGELLFAGHLVIFTRVEGLAAFRQRVVDLVRDRFGAAEPETAASAMEAADFVAAVRDVQQQVRADTTARELVLAALAATGLAVEETYWDWLHLRVLPPGAAHAAAGTGWHRDTWASNLAAQTNWWTPIFPITAERTIGFAPARWQHAVANDSDTWSPAAVRGGAAPLIPEPQEPLDDVAELPVVVDPDDLLCFSGAHLHRSVPNVTDRARFSIELRTVNAADVRAGRGAPAVDGHAADIQYRWFRHVRDGRPLTTAPQNG